MLLRGTYNAVAVATEGLTADQPWEDYALMFVLAKASALTHVFVTASRSLWYI